MARQASIAYTDEAARVREEAQALAEAEAYRNQVRAKEAAYLAEIKAAQEKREADIAAFGTDDPLLAARVKATEAFEEDLPARMRVDPEGTTAKVKRAEGLLGLGGPQDAPTGEGRSYYRGTGPSGEPWFTNLSPSESLEERRSAATMRGVPIQDIPKGKGMERIEGMRDQPTGAPKQPRTLPEIAFQGKLEAARDVVRQPEIDMKYAQRMASYTNEVLKTMFAEDVTTARQKVEDDLMSGKLLKLGLRPKAAQDVDRLLVNRAKTLQEFAGDPTLDRTFYAPWHKSGKKPGLSADLAEPASILNPGGSISDQAMSEQLLTQAKQARDAALEGRKPAREMQTTASYTRQPTSVAEFAGEDPFAEVLSSGQGFLAPTGKPWRRPTPIERRKLERKSRSPLYGLGG